MTQVCERVVVVTGKPGVGQVLAAWMNRLDVSPTELARLAQLSRATVYVVLDSRSRNPGTMKQLAFGLATTTDRHGEEVTDPSIEQNVLRELMIATGNERLLISANPASPAGEGRTVDDLTDDEVVTELERRVGDRDVAVSLLAAANNWRSLPPRSQRLILETVRYAAGDDEDDQASPRRRR